MASSVEVRIAAFRCLAAIMGHSEAGARAMLAVPSVADGAAIMRLGLASAAHPHGDMAKAALQALLVAVGTDIGCVKVASLPRPCRNV